MTIDKLSHAVIGCAYKVHSALGPGLLELAYQKCLEHELVKAGFTIETEKRINLVYDTLTVKNVYRVDIIVEGKLVLELKAAEKVTLNHIAQLNTYLKLLEIENGLILNFSESSLRHGIKRVLRK